MSPSYQALKNKIKRKQNTIAKHQNQLNMLLRECPHEEIEPKESYYEGSYLNKASTDYWNQCKLCGARSEVTTQVHSWYG